MRLLSRRVWIALAPPPGAPRQWSGRASINAVPDGRSGCGITAGLAPTARGSGHATRAGATQPRNITRAHSWVLLRPIGVKTLFRRKMHSDCLGRYGTSGPPVGRREVASTEVSGCDMKRARPSRAQPERSAGRYSCMDIRNAADAMMDTAARHCACAALRSSSDRGHRLLAWGYLVLSADGSEQRSSRSDRL